MRAIGFARPHFYRANIDPCLDHAVSVTPTETAWGQQPRRKQTMKATKKIRQRFLAQAKQLLFDLGATQEGDDFVLQTRAGRLKLYPSNYEGEILGTVFSRFDDPQAARQFVDCNRFSGKWNFHYFHGWTVETAIADLKSWLRRVLPDTD